MRIQQVKDNKIQYLDLLQFADPKEEALEKELDTMDLFLLKEDGVIKTICAVRFRKNRKCEILSIVTMEEARGCGYGKYMVHYICEHYSDRCDELYVGIGNCRKLLGFFEKCGFSNSHILAGYFLKKYKEPVYDDGIPLTDMVYFKKRLEAEIDIKKVVDVALEAGRILLKNGGEIFRVEETMTRICNRFHIDQVDIFTLSHAIFVTAKSGEEEVYTKVKNVPLSGTHLGIVAEVNSLSRAISAGRMSLEEAQKRLKEIDKIEPIHPGVQIIGAGFASGCLGYLLGATARESVVAFFIGCILYCWVLLARRYHMSKIISNIAGGVIITGLALAAREVSWLAPVQLNGMIIGALMPLIPGMAFVNSIREIADSDFLSGTVRMIDTLLVFVYIAIGVGLTLSIYHTLGGIVG